jgi:hypothetical protein
LRRLRQDDAIDIGIAQTLPMSKADGIIKVLQEQGHEISMSGQQRYCSATLNFIYNRNNALHGGAAGFAACQ